MRVENDVPEIERTEEPFDHLGRIVRQRIDLPPMPPAVVPGHDEDIADDGLVLEPVIGRLRDAREIRADAWLPMDRLPVHLRVVLPVPVRQAEASLALRYA